MKKWRIVQLYRQELINNKQWEWRGYFRDYFHFLRGRISRTQWLDLGIVWERGRSPWRLLDFWYGCLYDDILITTWNEEYKIGKILGRRNSAFSVINDWVKEKKGTGKGDENEGKKCKGQEKQTWTESDEDRKTT